MKRKIIILTCLILVCVCTNAHNPINDNLDVFIDNIFVGKKSNADFSKISLVLLDNYYCGYLFECNNSSAFLLDDLHPRKIKKLYIESEYLLDSSGILKICTKKAQDGYLFVNKFIMDTIISLNYDLDQFTIVYVYNNMVVTTKNDVMRLVGLKCKNIQVSNIIFDKQSNIITVYIIDK